MVQKLSSEQGLSKTDVARLLSEPSAENRVETARKVATYFVKNTPTGAERALAEDIFRVLVRDAEVRVRKALSDTLKESPDLPQSVARALVADVNDVSLPVIMSSAVLDDEDLLDIIASQDPERQLAVAQRASISAGVADALVDQGDESVVSKLVGNEGAAISDSTFSRVLDKFSDNDKVKEPLVKRKKLPLVIAERLVSMVTETLRDHLVTHHELSPTVAADLFLESRERATVTLLVPGVQAPDLQELVSQLHDNGRLTPTLIIRALCMGDMAFFEAALAQRANIPASNAWQLIHDRGRLGLQRLFEKAALPRTLLDVARIGVDTAEETRLTSGDDRKLFRNIMIERILTQIDERLDSENLDYLIAKLGRNAA